MTTINVVLAKIPQSARGGSINVLPSVYTAQEDLTSSASSQTTTNGAGAITDTSDTFWEVTVSGGNVRMLAGPAGTTVTATTGRLLVDGTTRSFRASATGEVLAFINA